MFEEFMQPELQVPYAHNLSDDQLKKAWVKAEPVLNNKEKYNHDDWFYGGSGVEKWIGYSLRYDIIKSYMKKRNEDNPAQFIDIPRARFPRGLPPMKFCSVNACANLLSYSSDHGYQAGITIKRYQLSCNRKCALCV